MGDIDKVRQIHSNWLEFIKKYYQYYYHGVSQRCVKDYYFVPYGFLVLKDKVIPPYWTYKFNGDASYGNISVTKYKQNGYYYMDNGSYGWVRLSNTMTNYSGLYIVWKNPPQQGSIVYTITVSNLSYGVNASDGTFINRCSFGTNQQGYVGYSSDPQGRYDHTFTECEELFRYISNPYSERWAIGFGTPNDVSINYSIYWEKLPDGRFMVADSLGSVSYGRSIVQIVLLVRLLFYITTGSNWSGLAQARVATLSGLKFYNVKYW